MKQGSNGNVATLPLINRFSLPVSAQQEQFGIAWINAIAATAGYTTSIPGTDYDSVDITISQRCRNEHSEFAAFPTLSVQVKSTFYHKPGKDIFKFPLSIKNYDDLRVDVEFPRILVVVHTPEKFGDWILAEDQKMSLSHGAYWVCLRGYPHTTNKKGVSIDIPVIQKFTVQSLVEIMDKLAEGVRL